MGGGENRLTWDELDHLAARLETGAVHLLHPPLPAPRGTRCSCGASAEEHAYAVGFGWVCPGCDTYRPAAARMTSGVEDPAIAVLNELGFADRDIRDEGDYFVVERDMEFSKEELREHGRENGGSVPSRPSFAYAVGAGAGPRTVDNNFAAALAVDVSRLQAYPRWRTAILNAMAAWRSIPGANVYLYDQAGTGHTTRITIYTYSGSCGSGDAIARAKVGQPGDYIKVNLNCLHMSDGKLLYAAVHEFGHTLGFKHSDENPCTTEDKIGDWFGFTECATHVPGTPTFDEASIMGRSAKSDWTGFTENDRYSARYMFQGYGPTASGYPDGSTPVVTWSAVLDAQSYEVYKSYPIFNEASLMWDYRYVLAGTTTGNTFRDSATTGGPCASPHPEIPATQYVVKAVFRNNVVTWFSLQGFCTSF